MTETIKTVGVYVIYNSRFVFQVGLNQHLGIVRLGGHIEEGESFMTCARREVFEESFLELEFIDPPFTYKVSPAGGDLLYTDTIHREKPRPVIESDQNAMFLAFGSGEARPNHETQGLIFLNRAQISQLCSESITLNNS